MAIPLTKTKSAIPDEEMADFVYVRNLVRNDDLDTCVLDFFAQSVRNAGIGDDYVNVFKHADFAEAASSELGGIRLQTSGLTDRNPI